MIRAVRQLGGGLVYAFLSLAIVIGVFSLALAESSLAPQPTATLDPSAILQTLVSTQMSARPTATPSLPATGTATALTFCTPPPGWLLILVQPGDTLSELAARYQTTPEALTQANCLSRASLPPGSGLYVPPLPTQKVVIACGPLPGWVRDYVVAPGDTLYHISRLYSTTVGDLQRANCLNSTLIYAGQTLWVPNVPTITPRVTIIPEFGTPTEVPTEPLTSTPLPFTSTPSPTAPPPTATPSATPDA